MSRLHRIAIMSLMAAACNAAACNGPVAPPAEEEKDPLEALQECGLPEPCEVAAYDLCVISGPDEEAIRCVLTALSGTGPVHVAIYRSTVCGDTTDFSSMDFFRWEDGNTTCLFRWNDDKTPGGAISIYSCEPVTRTECINIDPDMPLPSLCFDFRDWGIGDKGETEAVCH